MFGGGKKETPPFRLGNLTAVHRSTNAYDYTGMDTLEFYKGDPLLRGLGYFYIHDTCLVSPEVVPFWRSLKERLSADPYLIMTNQPKGHFHIVVMKGVCGREREMCTLV